ncbi:hypothetical protein [Streptomyces sp. NPDC051546]|uniref:hypothetical protein n=1 Tax=Streptomyces sp. NPDC051546 TaxID=3365655 RepID=UPI0037B807DA
MDDTLLDRLEAALDQLEGTAPERERFARLDEDVLRVLVDAAERAARAQAQVWALVDATVDTDPSLVIWGARLFHDLSATGEDAARTDAAMRERAAKTVRNEAQWRSEALDKVSQLVVENRERLARQVEQAEGEIAAGPPPRPQRGFGLL